MIGIVVNVAKKYWTKYYSNEEGILEEWDKEGDYYVHFKLPKKPKQEFNKVFVNLGGKLRGNFEKFDVKFLNLKELRSLDLDEDFKPGFFVRCNSITWDRFKKEVPRKIIRGFHYTTPNELNL